METTIENSVKMDRLQKRSDFLRARDAGVKWVAKGMVLQAVPNERGVIRFGVTATKKLEKTAVGRNRMKRRLRACATNILKASARSGMDYVLIARNETATRDFKDLEKDLRWCLGKLGYAV